MANDKQEIREAAYGDCARLLEAACECPRTYQRRRGKYHVPGCVGLLAQVIRCWSGAEPEPTTVADSEHTKSVKA